MDTYVRRTQKETLPQRFARIRRQAEERIAKWPKLTPNSDLDFHVVVRELKIHLAELEIQNEELRLELKEMSTPHDKDENKFNFDPLKLAAGRFDKNDHDELALLDKPFKN